MKKINLVKLVVVNTLAAVCTVNAFAQSTNTCQDEYLNAIQEMNRAAVPQARVIVNERSSESFRDGILAVAIGATAGAATALLTDANPWGGAGIGGGVGLFGGGAYNEFKSIEGEAGARDVLAEYAKLQEVQSLLYSVNAVNTHKIDYPSIAEINKRRVQAFASKYVFSLENAARLFRDFSDEYYTATLMCGLVRDAQLKDQCVVDQIKLMEQVLNTLTRIDSSGEICSTDGEVASLEEVVNLIKADLNK